MKVINYFESNMQQYWLEQIRKCDWGAGTYLYELISNGTFFETVGEHSKILLLIEDDVLISFCTYAEKDDIQPTELTPWVGFVYTFPQYRGHRYIGRLFEEIEHIAKEEATKQIYISTNHTGLYEKYGCNFFMKMNDMHGEVSRVYIKTIQ